MTTSRLNAKEQVASIWHLGGLSLGEIAHGAWKEIIEGDISTQASGLAFNFILAIFPLLLFLVSLFGFSAARGTEMRTNLFLYLSKVLPAAPFHLVTSTIQEIMRNSSGGKITFGIVSALWFASGGMSSIISALNSSYAIHDRRSWIKVRFVALMLTIAISVLTVSAFVLVLVGNGIVEFIGQTVRFGSQLVVAWHIFQYPVALLFVVISFSMIYFYGPDLKEQHWYWITPGSLLGVMLWLAASLSFRAYLHYFNSYGKTYGSLGAVIALLVWLYVTGFAFLLGGKINADIEHAAARKGHPEAKAPGERKAA
jgi:membrane protein